MSLVSRTREMMGTLVSVQVPRGCEAAADSAFRAMGAVDSLMSVRREGSDVWRMNHFGGRWVQVSDLTLDCLRLALEAAERTDGAFDPTAGALVHAWRFDRDRQAFPPESTIRRALELVDYRGVEIRSDSVRLQLGQWLDLGGIAKGYAIDLAVAELRRLGVRSGIVDAGGDLYLIGDKSGRSFRTGIRHPRDREDLIHVLGLRDRSVCTSGDYERYFTRDGRRYTHIFDPRTGYPVADVMSVTVIGERAALTDAYATGLFVLGPERGIDVAENLPGIEALIVYGEDFSERATSGFQRYLIKR
jgi:thiamine biosynthesis lipoprotein